MTPTPGGDDDPFDDCPREGNETRFMRADTAEELGRIRETQKITF